jgi:hypothetical protein
MPGLTIPLRTTLVAVCPIDSVRIGDPNDKTTWSFDPSPSATADQIAAANAALAALSAPLQPPPPGPNPLVAAVLAALVQASALTQQQADAGLSASQAG